MQNSAKAKPRLLWKILKALLLLLLVVVLFAGISARRCLPIIWQNLTVSHLPDPATKEWEGGKIYSHIPYAAESESQYLDLYVPDIPSPQLFVLIHGGGFVAGDADTRQVRFMYDYFRDHGYACASINYRLAGEAPFPAAVCDCKAAIRFLRFHAADYGYDGEKLAVFGESAGGYLALLCSGTTDEEFSSLPFIGEERAVEENAPEEATEEKAVEEDTEGEDAAEGTEGEEDTEGNETETENAESPSRPISSMVDCCVAYYPHIAPVTSEVLNDMGMPSWLYLLANNWLIGHTGGFEEFESYWLRKNYSEMSQQEQDAVTPSAYFVKNADQLSGLHIYLIHGDADITVPYSSSVKLKETLDASLGAKKTYFRTEPALGHASDMLYREEILEEIDGFLKEHLQ